MSRRILAALVPALVFGLVAPVASAPPFPNSAPEPVLCATEPGEYGIPGRPDDSVPCGLCSGTGCKGSWFGATCFAAGQWGTCGGLQIGPDPLMCSDGTHQCDCMIILD